MGLFDRFFRKTADTDTSYTPSSEQEAFFGIIYTCMLTDGELGSDDIKKLIDITVREDRFVDFDSSAAHLKVGEAEIDFGGIAVVKACCTLIKDEDKEWIFEHALRVVLSDGYINMDERPIIDAIAHELGITEDQTHDLIEKVVS